MNIGMLTSKRKPQKCPACGSNKVARILYGYIEYTPELHRDLKEGRIVLGGCIVSDNDAVWQSIEVTVPFFHVNQLEKLII